MRTENRTQHTPGPWIQDRSCEGRTVVANDPNGIAFNLAHLPGEHPMQEANARLIAAAPDLLEACKPALEMLDCAEMERMKLRGKAKTIRQLRAAIAKAQG